jgi:hypothetical protein
VVERRDDPLTISPPRAVSETGEATQLSVAGNADVICSLAEAQPALTPEAPELPLRVTAARSGTIATTSMYTAPVRGSELSNCEVTATLESDPWCSLERRSPSGRDRRLWSPRTGAAPTGTTKFQVDEEGEAAVNSRRAFGRCVRWHGAPYGIMTPIGRGYR